MNKIAEGFNSEIFEINSDKVLKLYKPEFAAVVKIEYEKMLQLRKFGIKIPVVYEHRITIGRHGYIIESYAIFFQFPKKKETINNPIPSLQFRVLPCLSVVKFLLKRFNHRPEQKS